VQCTSARIVTSAIPRSDQPTSSCTVSRRSSRAGDYGQAVEVAARVEPDGLATLPRERRANFLVDAARCSFQVGQHERSVVALLEAESMAADEVRCRPLAVNLVRELSRTATGKSSWPLQQLMSRGGFSLS
jgi:hypothetical protein